MAKVSVKPTSTSRRAIIALKKSNFIAEQLRPLAQTVFDEAGNDPNEEFVRTLRMRTFVSGGPAGRISWQIGAGPTIGSRVEAKRGTLARALGLIG